MIIVKNQVDVITLAIGQLSKTSSKLCHVWFMLKHKLFVHVQVYCIMMIIRYDLEASKISFIKQFKLDDFGLDLVWT